MFKKSVQMIYLGRNLKRRKLLFSFAATHFLPAILLCEIVAVRIFFPDSFGIYTKI